MREEDLGSVRQTKKAFLSQKKAKVVAGGGGEWKQGLVCPCGAPGIAPRWAGGPGAWEDPLFCSP